jgi:hypothetical protein
LIDLLVLTHGKNAMATLRDALVKSKVVTPAQAEKAEREAKAEGIQRDRECRFRDLAAQLPKRIGDAVVHLHRESPGAVPERLVEELVQVHRLAKLAPAFGLDPRIYLADATFRVPGFAEMMGKITFATIQLDFAEPPAPPTTQPNGSDEPSEPLEPSGSSEPLGPAPAAPTAAPTPAPPSPGAVRDAAAALNSKFRG